MAEEEDQKYEVLQKIGKKTSPPPFTPTQITY